MSLLTRTSLTLSFAIVTLFSAYSPIATAESSLLTNKQVLDWVPSSDPDNLCGGSYIQPPFPSIDQTSLPNTPVFIDAEQGVSQLGKGSVLSGEVKIVKGQRSLYSESATIDQETGKIELTGGAVYREPGILFSGERAESNTESLNTSIYQASYLVHEYNARGNVDKITRNNDDETITIESGSYTQCPPGDETWLLSADQILLDPDSGFGKAKHATLKLGSVPVLYVPLFYFPIDDRRQSGFLYPNIRYSDSDGLELSTPYYFNLAPNYDDTLTPRLFAKRGLMLDNEFRYMNDYSTNSLNTAFLPDDNKADRNRWLLGVKHQGTSSLGWYSYINYLAVSDDDYFDDIGAKYEITGASHLDRLATAGYFGSDWQAQVTLQSYQTIDESLAPYRKLPQISVTGAPDSLNNNIANTAFLADFTRFDRDLDGLSDVDRVIGNRFHLQPQIDAEFRNTWGYIKPRAKYWFTQYNLDNQLDGFDDNPSVSVPILSLDSGLYLDRNIELLDKSYQNTLEPRLFALYVPEEDQSAIPDFDTKEYRFNYRSLFRDNRFSGLDRIGDTQQLSLGVTSRLINPQGIETLTASVGQAYYFEDRTVTLGSTTESDYTSNVSDLAASLNWRPNKRLSTSFEANFSHEELSNTDSNFSIRYQEDINRIVSFSYRYSDDVRNQSTASFIWPVSKQWSTIGVWQYDWLNDDDIDTAIGIEYESCCWKTRLIARHWLKDNDDKDSAIYLQFSLKGLGRFGSSGGTDFVEKITGFEQREEYNEQF